MQLKKTEAHSTKCHVEFYPLSDYEKVTRKRSPIRSSYKLQEIEGKEGKKTNWVIWVMGVAIVALAAGLVIALV